MSATKWSCGVCTFENSAGFTCGMCTTVDSGRHAALTASATATTAGGGVAASSSMSSPLHRGASGGSGSSDIHDDGAAPADGWSCSACTMFNPEDDDNDECHVCGTVNQQRIDDRAVAEEKRRVDDEKKKADEEAKQERIVAEKKRLESERRARLVPHYWRTIQILDTVTPFTSKSSSSGGASSSSSSTNGTSMSRSDSSTRPIISAKRSLSRTTSSGTSGTSVEKKARSTYGGILSSAGVAATPSSPTPSSAAAVATVAPDVEPIPRAMMIDLYGLVEHKSTPPVGSLVGDSCNVCYVPFDATTIAMNMTTCGHRTICRVCLAAHICARIDAKDVVPWIPCPAECRTPIHPGDLMNSGVSAYDQWRFMNIYLSKMLPRCEEWVECKTDKCGFGWWVTDTKKSKKKCDRCHKEQTVERKKEELDDEFKRMIANGTIRPCPKCQLQTMKEKGICNVIQCAKCSIWWNWKTKETGNNSSDLKNRARANGSLWEPGELHFQQNLERSNPEEFRKLLERNGMNYDPNYVRGT